jgi:hypothetical protein
LPADNDATLTEIGSQHQGFHLPYESNSGWCFATCFIRLGEFGAAG